MRIDLPYLYRANPKAFVAAGALIAACFAVLIVKGLAGTSSGHSEPVAHTRTVATSTKTTVAQSGVTTPNPNYHPSYATSVPSSPLDQKIASAMGASGSEAAQLEALTPPSAAWTTEYPAVPASDTSNEQSYAVAFFETLLDRDYRTQSRVDLGRWLQAEAADLVLPGVSSEAGDHSLYATLMDPTEFQESPGAVPSSADWMALANAGASEHVYDLLINPDPDWSQAQSDGLTSADPLLDAEDVTGAVTTTVGARSTTKHFSAQIGLGSALHHPGYGAWGVYQWEVN